MRPELERLRHLEAQLLAPGAGAAGLPLGPGPLPADVAAQRQAYQVLRQAGRQQLRRELAAIHRQLYGPSAGRWAWVAGLRQVFVRWGRPRPGRS
ncbi:hypothetical protein HHL22_10570 [Hymenobacter sp. RP-2-7]|uniref:Uncharacterized protein n=1 Tax=Hymenobacter polaris TaxID=2682546 RepID=A0A7Y0AE48_9BACT|nr:hypothetical protein [Hymenobacter polaris]NML65649.1 hypothetical protein [Hymenobacter polaris]